MSKFWRFCDFLHRFKKILPQICKKAQCYAVAWLFHFKILAQTQLCRPSGYRDYLLFVPYSRVLRYCKLRSGERGTTYIFRNLPPMKSRVLLRSGAGIPVSFAYYMTGTS